MEEGEQPSSYKFSEQGGHIMSSSNMEQSLEQRGISRREFLKFCTVIAGTLALESTVGSRIARALEAPKRTPVIWLELQDCAGCSESFLRASRPTAAEVVLDVLSVDYHETIMAASGHLAEEAKAATIAAGGYLLVVEGSIPTAEDGIYCTIGGRTAVDILEEAAAGAIAVVAVGNCATFGGLPKATPNPTGAVAVGDLVEDKPVLNLSGCPLNVVNLTATVVHFLTFGALPEMDNLGRPLFAHGARIHDNCERRGHFDAGEFVRAWGDEGHRKGWCLYQMGCKGPVSYHNCPTVRWNEGVSWPVGSGHGCIGCSEPGFWEMGAYNTAEIFDVTPPATYPLVEEAEGISPAGAGVIGGLAGLAIGAAGMAAVQQLSKSEQGEQDEE
jgi:hydrogenase small subunit